MKSPFSDASKSVRVNSETIQQELSQIIVHLEATTRRVADPRFRKIAMKSTEVLKGLRTLFERLGSEDETKRSVRPDSSPTDSEAGGHLSEVGGRKKSAKTSARFRQPNGSPGAASQKKSGTGSVPGGSKTGTRTRTKATRPISPQSAALTPAVPAVVTSKPEDPDATAAMARLRRKEARAPKRPGGHAPPKPLPPQSGKPIWSKPHSA